MRNFDLLDTSTFKAFWVASETLNFTEAARKCSMTQSGISQHISRIETQIGVPLFLRVNKKVLLTTAGKKFKSYVENYLDQVDLLREDLTEELTTLTGAVSYAMPESCLMSPHFGILLEKRKERFPELGLKVQICPSEQVIEKLMRDEIDFGFVTKNIDTAGIKLVPFCLEEYVLVSSKKQEVSQISLDAIEAMNFIGYPGCETLFDQWKSRALPRNRKLGWSTLNVIGEMGSLKGVIEMVEQGMGVTIIPVHCVASSIEANRLYRDRTKDKKPANNQIYIAILNDAMPSRRVKTVIETFQGMVN